MQHVIWGIFPSTHSCLILLGLLIIFPHLQMTFYMQFSCFKLPSRLAQVSNVIFCSKTDTLFKIAIYKFLL